MKLSFDDKKSSKEATGSLCFNNPPSDLGTSGSIPTWPQSQERSEGTWGYSIQSIYRTTMSMPVYNFNFNLIIIYSIKLRLVRLNMCDRISHNCPIQIFPCSPMLRETENHVWQPLACVCKLVPQYPYNPQGINLKRVEKSYIPNFFLIKK